MFSHLMDQGGGVMWVLLAMSVVALTLILERSWFWLRTNNRAQLARVAHMARLLRQGDDAGARVLAEGDETVYGRLVHRLVREPVTEALLTEVIESERARIERFMGTLSTVISAAPMLGILGTVLGLIFSSQVLSQQATQPDPQAVMAGIAEALLTTAAGLVVTIVVLFPYNVFRAQVNRTFGRLEALAASAAPEGNPAKHPKNELRIIGSAVSE